MRILLIVTESLVSVFLVILILLQRARNEGLGMAFGANMGESLFGSRAGNVLTRMTVWCCSIFVVNTIILAMLYAGGGGTGESRLMKESAPVPVATPLVPTPVATPAPASPSPEASAAPAAAPVPTPVAVPVVPATPAPTPAPAG